MAKSRNELKDLKQFGMALAGILLALGAVNLFKGRTNWYPWFFSLSIASILLALLAPKHIKPVFTLFTKVGHVIGWVNTRIVLTIIYFLIITPMALIMKVIGKDPLDRKIEKDRVSYWVKRAVVKTPGERLEKQF
ncbi:MAG: SxtJ family membrane protein [Candidatus Omnitrophica bacterium]|nr:SxtJ family membrane protein [Candidatus Omnitrophota bacterium]MDD5680159.1 SxtJ family membrane protein [Candidatus Omnitrophota bacterium]